MTDLVAGRHEPGRSHGECALGIPRAYGSYAALLADPEIEAIYNPLPNHLHVPLTLRDRVGAGRWSRLREARGTLSPPALGGSVAMRIRPIIHDTGGTRWRSC